MSLYAEYVKLEEKYKIIETEHGFMTYQITGKEFYVSDFYARKRGKESYEIWNEAKRLAVEHGCEVFTGNVWLDPTRSEYATKKLKIFMGHGFKVQRADKNIIMVLREV